jgi:uncharacterized C2H2 Zn-finger protein
VRRNDLKRHILKVHPQLRPEEVRSEVEWWAQLGLGATAAKELDERDPSRFYCPACTNNYAQRGDLKRHILKKHPQLRPEEVRSEVEWWAQLGVPYSKFG